MKTSNKLLIASVLVIVISMVTYDFALRAEFKKGTYKSRFYGFEKIKDLKGFNSIDNRAANLVSVKVEQGNNYEIWVKSDWKDRIRILDNGTELTIELADKKNPNLSGYENNVVVICPSLNQVTTTPFIVPDKNNEIDFSGITSISGFTQQQLILQINKATNIDLEKNKIGQLQASVGDNLSHNARLTIGTSNQINDAIIKVAGRNMLDIQNAKITKSNFNISDSAQVNFAGSFLNQLKNPQQ